MSDPALIPAPSGHRLGGALAVIFWCACGLTALALSAPPTLAISIGVSGFVSLVQNLLTDSARMWSIWRLELLPHVAFTIWAAGMIVLTIARSRIALLWGPWGLVAWVVISAWAEVSLINLLAPAGIGLAGFAGLLPGTLMKSLTAAAMFGYFREGSRPKAFYNQ